MYFKEKLKDVSEDGASTTSRKRKEPPELEGSDRASYRERDDRGAYKDRDREREKDKERTHGREYEKDRHSSRHGREEYDRDRREYRDRDRDRDRDREYYGHSSGRHRDSGRDR